MEKSLSLLYYESFHFLQIQFLIWGVCKERFYCTLICVCITNGSTVLLHNTSKLSVHKILVVLIKACCTAIEVLDKLNFFFG